MKDTDGIKTSSLDYIYIYRIMRKKILKRKGYENLTWDFYQTPGGFFFFPSNSIQWSDNSKMNPNLETTTSPSQIDLDYRCSRSQILNFRGWRNDPTSLVVMAIQLRRVHFPTESNQCRGRGSMGDIPAESMNKCHVVDEIGLEDSENFCDD